MSKKSFASAPKPKTLSPEDLDRYVQGGAGHDTTKPKKAMPKSDGPTKRLSIDLPADLHRRFKTACSATDKKMATELIAFIEQRTSELESEIKST